MGAIFSPPKAPAAPDPAATIEAQKEANQIAQFTPSGNLVYGSYDPETGQFVERATDALRVTESPFQQLTREGGEELTQNLLSQLLANPNVLTDVRTATDIEGRLSPLSTDFGADIARLEQSTYEAAASRLRPEFERQREQLEQRLADQGLPIGSEAYQEELNRLEESQNEQLSRLSLDAVSAGRQEQDRLARLGAALRGQEFSEQSGLRTLEEQARARGFGEIGSVLGFASPFTQFSTPQIDVAGIINQGYQNQIGQFGLRQQGRQEQAGNIAGLAQTGALLFSDKRLKKNIEKVGNVDGINVYEFEYKTIPDTRFKGVMADEIEEIMPDAVITNEQGYKMVNYDKLPINMEIVYG